MQLSDRTDEQISADIQQLKNALDVPNLPNDEREMHTSLLYKLQLEMGRRMNAFHSEAPKKQQQTRVEDHSLQSRSRVNSPTLNRSPLGVGGAPTLAANTGNAIGQGNPKSRTILAGGHTKTAEAITSKIEFANNSTQFNPAITITWSDGYQITVDETAATGRFKSTFRDTLALKCVSEGRTEKMWRWDTPWRAAGFYDAITTMRNGLKPTLKDLGYTHPSDKQREVFSLITQAFIKEATDI